MGITVQLSIILRKQASALPTALLLTVNNNVNHDKNAPSPKLEPEKPPTDRRRRLTLGTDHNPIKAGAICRLYSPTTRSRSRFSREIAVFAYASELGAV